MSLNGRKRMRDTTRENLRLLVDYLYPPLDRLLSREVPEGGNAVEERRVIVYSRRSGGKTSTVQYLVKEAKERYGEENVNALEGDPFELFIWGWSKKPVEIFVIEDVANRRLDRDTLILFSKLRDFKKEFAGVGRGLIVIFITTHSFYSIPEELRVDADVIIFKHAPTNLYDYKVVKDLVGEAAVKLMEKLRDPEDPDKYKPYSFVFIGYEGLGFIETDLVDKQTKRLVVKRVVKVKNPYRWVTLLARGGLIFIICLTVFLALFALLVMLVEG
jgi:hypothetical protein